MNTKRNRRYFMQRWISAILTMMCCVATIQGAGYALHTTTNHFFRTTKLSQELCAVDGSFTYELWFKENGGGVLINEVDQYVVSYWDKSFLEVDAGGNIYMALPGLIGAAAVGTVELGTWNHVALRYNRTDQTLSVFINGVKSSATLTGVRQLSDHTAFIAFGRAATTPINVGGWFDGDIDEVQLWNVARSDDEIVATWKSKLDTATGLSTSWHLDEGTGTDAADASGNSDPALIVGATWVTSNLLSDVPVILTLSGTGFTDRTALLSATVNAGTFGAKAYFEYGTTTNYGASTLVTNITAANADVKISNALSNLALGGYDFRLVLSNDVYTVISSNQTFAITNLAGFAASLNVNTNASNYFRSTKITRPFFTNGAITVELWFNAKGPGVIVNEVDSLNVTKWDYSFLEVLPGGVLVAGLPSVPTINAGNIQFNRWYQCVLRYDPATRSLDLFLDGVKVGTSVGTRSLPWDNNSTVYLAFGRGRPDNLGGGAYFSGLIDEVRIWRIPLTDAQIMANRDLIIPGNDSNLFAYWSFDTVTGNSTPDKSPNANPTYFENGQVFDFSPLDLSLDLRPSAVTGTVTDAIGTTAGISGTAFSQDTNTLAYFEWSIGTLTNRTSPVAVTGRTNNPVQATLSGLEGGKTYTFSLVVSNSTGVARGLPVSFVKLGVAGYSLSLGTNVYLRSVSDQKTFFPDETITAEIWVKPVKAGVVMSETDRLNTNAFDRSVIEILTNGTVVAGFVGLGTIQIGSITFGQWNSIVIRYSKAELNLSGFVNGVEGASTSPGDRTAGWEVGSSTIYTFGKPTLNKIGTGESLPAEWDEIRLWNIARSKADIQATYNKRLSGTESGLVGYYRFDDRLSSITDSSGHNNKLQIVNAGSQFVTSGAPVLLNLTPIRIAADGTITVQYAGNPLSQIRAEGTSDFQSWTVGPTGTADSQGIVTLNVGNTADASLRFFRFKQL